MTFIFDQLEAMANDVFRLRCAACASGLNGAARLVVESLTSGTLGLVVKTVHEAFEAGEDLDPRWEDMMRHTFEARIALLDREGQVHADALAYADEVLREYGSAVLTIDDEAYEVTLYDYDRETKLVRYDYRPRMAGRNEWWTARERLAERVPEGVVEQLLTEIGEEQR